MAEPLFNELQNEEIRSRGLNPRDVEWRWVELAFDPPASFKEPEEKPSPRRRGYVSRVRCPVVIRREHGDTVILPNGKSWSMAR